MSNEVVRLSNWMPFLSEDRNPTFDEFIDLIKKMDSNTSPDVWVKWKNYSNQVVIETPHYFYKIYNTDYTAGLFFSLVREKLAEIYRDEFHIKWDVITIKKENSIYQLEQREKLQVCNEDVIDYDDLMINWSNTLNRLEDKLILPKITKQLQDKIKNLYKIKLVRDCVNKYEDYAITKDGNIVLLDDADWFLALIDEDNNWISSEFNCYEILTNEGYKTFVPQNYYEVIQDEDELLSSIHIPINKWIISQKNKQVKNEVLDFADKREQMLFNNIKVLSSGKYLENKQKLLVSKQIPYDFKQEALEEKEKLLLESK